MLRLLGSLGWNESIHLPGENNMNWEGRVEHYALHVCIPLRVYVKTLIPNRMISGDGAFVKLSLDEVMRLEHPW